MEIRYNSVLLNDTASLNEGVESDSYFLTYKWFKVVRELFAAAKLDRLLYTLQIFTTGSGDKIISGFFYKSRINKIRKIHFSHRYGSSDYYGWNYGPAVNIEDVKSTIRTIAANQQADVLHFSHVRADSLLYKALNDNPALHVSELRCVSIHFDSNYETYIRSLSKSVRQNLRTANNRVAKSDLTMRYEILTNKDSDAINWAGLRALYKKRNQHKKNKIHWKSKILHFLNYGFGDAPDMFDTDAIKETDFILAQLFLDGQLAAYFFGFRQVDRIEINRVVIDDEFKFYSPGLLLLTKYIEKELPTGLKELDLTVGDEKYKYDLGGKEHLIYNLKIEGPWE